MIPSKDQCFLIPKSDQFRRARQGKGRIDFGQCALHFAFLPRIVLVIHGVPIENGYAPFGDVRIGRDGILWRGSNIKWNYAIACAIMYHVVVQN